MADINFQPIYSVTGPGKCYRNPAVGQDSSGQPLIVAEFDTGGGHQVKAYAAANGAEKWATAVEDGTLTLTYSARPVIDDLDGDGEVEVIAQIAAGKVAVLDIDDGSVKKTFDLPAELAVDLQVADYDGDGQKEIYAASLNNSDGSSWVSAYNYYTGAENWRKSVGAGLSDKSGLALGELNSQKIGVVASGSVVYTFNLSDGQNVFDALDTGSPVVNKLAVVGDRIFLPAGPEIIVLNKATGQEETRIGVGKFVQDMTVGDFEGDGQEDIITPIYGSGTKKGIYILPLNDLSGGRDIIMSPATLPRTSQSIANGLVTDGTASAFRTYVCMGRSVSEQGKMVEASYDAGDLYRTMELLPLNRFAMEAGVLFDNDGRTNLATAFEDGVVSVYGVPVRVETAVNPAVWLLY